MSINRMVLEQLLWITTICFLHITTQSFGADDIFTTLERMPDCSRFVQAAKVVELVDTLDGGRTLTVFIPTNEAFDKLPKTLQEDLLKRENRTALTELIQMHVISGKKIGAQLKGNVLRTISGKEVDIIHDESHLLFGSARILQMDLIASNGVIHLIDRIQLPPEEAYIRSETQ